MRSVPALALVALAGLAQGVLARGTYNYSNDEWRLVADGADAVRKFDGTFYADNELITEQSGVLLYDGETVDNIKSVGADGTSAPKIECMAADFALVDVTSFGNDFIFDLPEAFPAGADGILDVAALGDDGFSEPRVSALGFTGDSFPTGLPVGGASGVCPAGGAACDFTEGSAWVTNGVDGRDIEPASGFFLDQTNGEAVVADLTDAVDTVVVCFTAEDAFNQRALQSFTVRVAPAADVDATFKLFPFAADTVRSATSGTDLPVDTAIESILLTPGEAFPRVNVVPDAGAMDDVTADATFTVRCSLDMPLNASDQSYFGTTESDSKTCTSDGGSNIVYAFSTTTTEDALCGSLPIANDNARITADVEGTFTCRVTAVSTAKSTLVVGMTVTVPVTIAVDDDKWSFELTNDDGDDVDVPTGITGSGRADLAEGPLNDREIVLYPGMTFQPSSWVRMVIGADDTSGSFDVNCFMVQAVDDDYVEVDDGTGIGYVASTYATGTSNATAIAGTDLLAQTTLATGFQFNRDAFAEAIPSQAVDLICRVGPGAGRSASGRGARVSIQLSYDDNTGLKFYRSIYSNTSALTTMTLSPAENLRSTPVIIGGQKTAEDGSVSSYSDVECKLWESNLAGTWSAAETSTDVDYAGTVTEDPITPCRDSDRTNNACTGLVTEIDFRFDLFAGATVDGVAWADDSSARILACRTSDGVGATLSITLKPMTDNILDFHADGSSATPPFQQDGTTLYSDGAELTSGLALFPGLAAPEVDITYPNDSTAGGAVVGNAGATSAYSTSTDLATATDVAVASLEGQVVCKCSTADCVAFVSAPASNLSSGNALGASANVVGVTGLDDLDVAGDAEIFAPATESTSVAFVCRLLVFDDSADDNDFADTENSWGALGGTLTYTYLVKDDVIGFQPQTIGSVRTESGGSGFNPDIVDETEIFVYAGEDFPALAWSLKVLPTTLQSTTTDFALASDVTGATVDAVANVHFDGIVCTLLGDVYGPMAFDNGAVLADSNFTDDEISFGNDGTGQANLPDLSSWQAAGDTDLPLGAATEFTLLCRSYDVNANGTTNADVLRPGYGGKLTITVLPRPASPSPLTLRAQAGFPIYDKDGALIPAGSEITSIGIHQDDRLPRFQADLDTTAASWVADTADASLQGIKSITVADYSTTLDGSGGFGDTDGAGFGIKGDIVQFDSATFSDLTCTAPVYVLVTEVTGSTLELEVVDPGACTCTSGAITGVLVEISDGATTSAATITCADLGAQKAGSLARVMDSATVECQFAAEDYAFTENGSIVPDGAVASVELQQASGDLTDGFYPAVGGTGSGLYIEFTGGSVSDFSQGYGFGYTDGDTVVAYDPLLDLYAALTVTVATPSDAEYRTAMDQDGEVVTYFNLEEKDDRPVPAASAILSSSAQGGEIDTVGTDTWTTLGVVLETATGGGTALGKIKCRVTGVVTNTDAADDVTLVGASAEFDLVVLSNKGVGGVVDIVVQADGKVMDAEGRYYAAGDVVDKGITLYEGQKLDATTLAVKAAADVVATKDALDGIAGTLVNDYSCYPSYSVAGTPFVSDACAPGKFTTFALDTIAVALGQSSVAPTAIDGSATEVCSNPISPKSDFADAFANTVDGQFQSQAITWDVQNVELASADAEVALDLSLLFGLGYVTPRLAATKFKIVCDPVPSGDSLTVQSFASSLSPRPYWTSDGELTNVYVGDFRYTGAAITQYGMTEVSEASSFDNSGVIGGTNTAALSTVDAEGVNTILNVATSDGTSYAKLVFDSAVAGSRTSVGNEVTEDTTDFLPVVLGAGQGLLPSDRQLVRKGCAVTDTDGFTVGQKVSGTDGAPAPLAIQNGSENNAVVSVVIGTDGGADGSGTVNLAGTVDTYDCSTGTLIGTGALTDADNCVAVDSVTSVGGSPTWSLSANPISLTSSSGGATDTLTQIDATIGGTTLPTGTWILTLDSTNVSNGGTDDTVYLSIIGNSMMKVDSSDADVSDVGVLLIGDADPANADFVAVGVDCTSVGCTTDLPTIKARALGDGTIQVKVVDSVGSGFAVDDVLTLTSPTSGDWGEWTGDVDITTSAAALGCGFVEGSALPEVFPSAAPAAVDVAIVPTTLPTVAVSSDAGVTLIDAKTGSAILPGAQIQTTSLPENDYAESTDLAPDNALPVPVMLVGGDKLSLTVELGNASLYPAESLELSCLSSHPTLIPDAYPTATSAGVATLEYASVSSSTFHAAGGEPTTVTVSCGLSRDLGADKARAFMTAQFLVRVTPAVVLRAKGSQFTLSSSVADDNACVNNEGGSVECRTLVVYEGQSDALTNTVASVTLVLDSATNEDVTVTCVDSNADGFETVTYSVGAAAVVGESAVAAETGTVALAGVAVDADILPTQSRSGTITCSAVGAASVSADPVTAVYVGQSAAFDYVIEGRTLSVDTDAVRDVYERFTASYVVPILDNATGSTNLECETGVDVVSVTVAGGSNSVTITATTNDITSPEDVVVTCYPAVAADGWLTSDSVSFSFTVEPLRLVVDLDVAASPTVYEQKTYSNYLTVSTNAAPAASVSVLCEITANEGIFTLPSAAIGGVNVGSDIPFAMTLVPTTATEAVDGVTFRDVALGTTTKVDITCSPAADASGLLTTDDISFQIVVSPIAPVITQNSIAVTSAIQVVEGELPSAGGEIRVALDSVATAPVQFSCPSSGLVAIEADADGVAAETSSTSGDALTFGAFEGAVSQPGADYVVKCSVIASAGGLAANETVSFSVSYSPVGYVAVGGTGAVDSDGASLEDDVLAADAAAYVAEADDVVAVWEGEALSSSLVVVSATGPLPGGSTASCNSSLPDVIASLDFAVGTADTNVPLAGVAGSVAADTLVWFSCTLTTAITDTAADGTVFTVVGTGSDDGFGFAIEVLASELEVTAGATIPDVKEGLAITDTFTLAPSSGILSGSITSVDVDCASDNEAVIASITGIQVTAAGVTTRVVPDGSVVGPVTADTVVLLTCAPTADAGGLATADSVSVSVSVVANTVAAVGGAEAENTAGGSLDGEYLDAAQSPVAGLVSLSPMAAEGVDPDTNNALVQLVLNYTPTAAVAATCTSSNEDVLASPAPVDLTAEDAKVSLAFAAPGPVSARTDVVFTCAVAGVDDLSTSFVVTVVPNSLQFLSAGTATSAVAVPELADPASTTLQVALTYPPTADVAVSCTASESDAIGLYEEEVVAPDTTAPAEAAPAETDAVTGEPVVTAAPTAAPTEAPTPAGPTTFTTTLTGTTAADIRLSTPTNVGVATTITVTCAPTADAGGLATDDSASAFVTVVPMALKVVGGSAAIGTDLSSLEGSVLSSGGPAVAVGTLDRPVDAGTLVKIVLADDDYPETAITDDLTLTCSPSPASILPSIVGLELKADADTINVVVPAARAVTSDTLVTYTCASTDPKAQSYEETVSFSVHVWARQLVVVTDADSVSSEYLVDLEDASDTGGAATPVGDTVLRAVAGQTVNAIAAVRLIAYPEVAVQVECGTDVDGAQASVEAAAGLQPVFPYAHSEVRVSAAERAGGIVNRAPTTADVLSISFQGPADIAVDTLVTVTCNVPCPASGYTKTTTASFSVLVEAPQLLAVAGSEPIAVGPTASAPLGASLVQGAKLNGEAIVVADSASTVPTNTAWIQATTSIDDDAVAECVSSSASVLSFSGGDTATVSISNDVNDVPQPTALPVLYVGGPVEADTTVTVTCTIADEDGDADSTGDDYDGAEVVFTYVVRPPQVFATDDNNAATSTFAALAGVRYNPELVGLAGDGTARVAKCTSASASDVAVQAYNLVSTSSDADFSGPDGSVYVEIASTRTDLRLPVLASAGDTIDYACVAEDDAATATFNVTLGDPRGDSSVTDAEFYVAWDIATSFCQTLSDAQTNALIAWVRDTVAGFAGVGVEDVYFDGTTVYVKAADADDEARILAAAEAQSSNAMLLAVSGAWPTASVTYPDLAGVCTPAVSVDNFVEGSKGGVVPTPAPGPAPGSAAGSAAAAALVLAGALALLA